jgi:hypothetical protein
LTDASGTVHNDKEGIPPAVKQRKRNVFAEGRSVLYSQLGEEQPEPEAAVREDGVEVKGRRLSPIAGNRGVAAGGGASWRNPRRPLLRQDSDQSIVLRRR